jgi:transposase-like protein
LRGLSRTFGVSRNTVTSWIKKRWAGGPNSPRRCVKSSGPCWSWMNSGRSC